MSRLVGRMLGAAAGTLLGAAGLVDAAAAMSLPEAAAAALRSNPDLQASRYAYQAALEGRRGAGTAYRPQVGLSADIGRVSTRDDAKINGDLTNISKDNSEPLNIAIDVSQDLYVGGARSASVDIAEAGAESARYGMLATEQDVLFDVVTVYADLVEAQEQVAIRQRDVVELQELVAATEKRLSAGVVSRTDIYQAQGRLALSQANLLTAELDLDVARATFMEIVGVEPGELAWPELSLNLPQSLQEAIDRARSTNPSLVGSLQQEVQQRARERLARADLRPTLAVVGRVDQAYTEYDEQDVSQSATARLQLRIPLYEGGLARSRVRESRANQRRAQAETESLRRELTRAAASAWSQVGRSRGVVQAAEQQLNATEQALEGVRREQALGLRTTLDVLFANDDVRQAASNLASVRRNALVADYTLLLVTGELGPGVFGVARSE